MRQIIAGGPRTGKTTLAMKSGGTVLHTDDLISMGWSEASQFIADDWMKRQQFCIEGIATVRALRKWLEANPSGKPCDEVIWLDIPKVSREKGQETMAKGCLKVWNEIRPELALRGVRIK